MKTKRSLGIALFVFVFSVLTPLSNAGQERGGIAINGKTVAKAVMYEGRPYLSIEDFARLINGAVKLDPTLKIEGSCAKAGTTCGITALKEGACPGCVLRVNQPGVISSRVQKTCAAAASQGPPICTCCGVTLDDLVKSMNGTIAFDKSTGAYAITAPRKCANCIVGPNS